jgi:hypothetical protein
MNTFTLTDDEREMIIEALKAHESEFATTSPESKEYFAKVLALADRLAMRPDGWHSSNKY